MCKKAEIFDSVRSYNLALTRAIDHQLFFVPSRNSQCLHRGASFLQQSGSCGEHLYATAHEHLSFQEGDGNLQLQLPQQHPRCQTQQTGKPVQPHPGGPNAEGHQADS